MVSGFEDDGMFRRTHEMSLFQVTNYAKQHEDGTSPCIVHDGVLNTCFHVVWDSGAVSPEQNIRPKAVVGEALRWVYQDIAA